MVRFDPNEMRKLCGVFRSNTDSLTCVCVCVHATVKNVTFIRMFDHLNKLQSELALEHTDECTPARLIARLTATTHVNVH